MAQKVSSLAIDINVTGAPQASTALSNVEKGGKSAAASLAGMATKGAIAGTALAGLAIGARKFLDAAEQYSRITARLTVVSDSLGQAKAVQDQLYQVAQQTGTEFESLVGTYARIALSAKDLGVTQQQMVQLTGNVAKALQVSGASASEAASGAQQLAQALGSGKLAGDELKAILENAPVLARSIAAGLGVSVGQLREMGSQGKLLSSDVFGAILRQTGAIDDQFSKLGDTMERSGTRLSNAFNRALASIDSKIGASRFLAALFNGIAVGIDGSGPGGVLGGSANSLGGGSGYTAGYVPGAAPARGAAASSRPRVGRAGQLAPVRVTASAPKKGGGSGSGGGLTGSRAPGLSSVSPVSSGRGGIDRLTLASRSSTTRGAGVGGGDAGIGDSVALIGANAEQQFGELVERLGTLSAGVGSTIVDSFANGITAAVQTGSISDGFKELGRTLIGGLGAQVRDFGIQSLKIGTLMEGLLKSLAGFIPGGTIGASVALIALGSAMVGLAGRGARSSFGRTNSGIDRGATSSSTIIERGTIGLPSSIYGGGATSAGPTGQVASAMQPVYVNATIIGPNDPSAQRQIAELVRKSAARGAA